MIRLFKNLFSAFLLWMLVSAHILHAQNRPGTPDPLRFEQEIAGFEQWDAKNSSPENSILFVGSSSIRFWNSAEAFPGYTVINRGFGGSHITDLIYYYDRIIDRFSPSLIVFYCGENDIASGLALHHVFDDYLEFLNRVKQDFNDLHFIFISIKPSNSRLEHSERFTAFNRMVQAHNRADPTLHYIDLASPLVRNGGPDNNYFVEDQLHLNERGYELWNERLTAFLKGLEENGVKTGRKIE